MASLNKVTLIGNLGSDPEVKYTGSGLAVANFSLATTEKWQSGEKTEWHRIVVFGKQAEICKEYLAKGRQIYIEGRLQTRQWDDKEGKKRYTTEVVVSRVLFLGKAPEGAVRKPQAASTSTQTTSFDGAPDFAPQADANPGFAVDDEIPF